MSVAKLSIHGLFLAGRFPQHARLVGSRYSVFSTSTESLSSSVAAVERVGRGISDRCHRVWHRMECVFCARLG